MPKKRQLAAIMFTDIEGYTAIMQRDEARAIQFRNEHRKIFNSTTEKYEGKILQYYGDGTLSIFDSAVSAVNCGIEMQRSFQQYSRKKDIETEIPVRIGIHLGDIIFSEEDIIGDSVNIASRIESLAAVGSVFISAKIYDEIKNKQSIEVQSMGLFELKNVSHPMEVFAISNKGLVVPDPKQIQGKAKKIENEDTIFKTLWKRSQPHMIAGYFIGVWGLIQLAEWGVNRYQISPHWLDVLLVFFISLTPSFILFFWNRDRINQGKINLLKKYIIPGNLMASVLLVFLIFKGTDLGATTRTVYFDNENGDVQSRIIIKPNFRKKLAIHNFIPEKEDSLHQWMDWGIHAGVADDISQNGYMTLGLWRKTESLQEMINLSKEDFYPYMLTGSYSVNGENYQITSKLYNTQSGELQNTHTFRSRDFFALIDTISMVAKKDLGFSLSQINQFVDLPFDQAITSNIAAYKDFSLFFVTNHIKFLEQAISLDSTFARANHTMASILYSHAFSLLGAKEAIEQGMRFRKRLPLNLESGLKLTYFQINNQPENAIALLKMQLEMNPGDQNIIHTLTSYLFLTERYEELLAWRKKLATMDPNPDTKVDLAEALILNNRIEEAGQLILKILDKYPNQSDAIGGLAMYYALTDQINRADSLIQKMIIQDPEFAPFANEFSNAFKYVNNHQPTLESLRKYTGHYRLQDRAAEYDIRSIDNILYGKGRSYMGGFFFIPSDHEEFIMGNNNLYEKWTFVSDTLGQVYQILAHRVESNGQVFNSILWRQDSLINEAMGLFAVDKRTEALEAFRMAYDKNPLHFYLTEYIKHLEFVLDPNNKDALENIKKYVGRYGPRRIWIENEKIYYQRDGMVSKQRLLPVSPDLFYFWGGFQFQIQVVVENDDVKGTVSWEYNNVTDKFVRDDDDFFAFDKSKD